MRAKLLRARLAGAGMFAALVLAGCGPGVGGTGTGGAAFTAFGASAESVCNGAIAAELDCAQAPAASGVTANSGTLPIEFVDVAGQVTLDLNGNVATLESSCQRLEFSGEFGRYAAGEGFFGTYHVDTSGIDAFAIVSASPAAGSGLTVELRDFSGQVVLGPLLLRRATVPLPAPSPC
ncbi:MAG TPA: hypothetical protein VGH48_11815 [Caldimonas sp.]|jgi:hypothetical protein